jgi:hypothetical protein
VAAERAALQPPRRAAPESFKIATISRAEGGQLQAPVGPLSDTAYQRSENARFTASPANAAAKLWRSHAWTRGDSITALRKAFASRP